MEKTFVGQRSLGRSRGVFKQQFKANVLIPTLTAGLTSGLLCAAFAISLTAIIFKGDLSPFLPIAIGIALLSSVVLSLVTACFSSSDSALATPQDAPSVLLALAAVSVTSQLASSYTPEIIFYTVLAVNGLTTILTAISLLLVAKFRLSNLVRFIPYPVVGGFLAGTGWLIFSSGMSLMVGDSVGIAQIPQLFTFNVLLQWLPGLALGLIMISVTAKIKHYLTWPLLLSGASLVFFLTMFLSGSTAASWRDMGLLLGPFSNEALWQPLNYKLFQSVPWTVVISQATQTATIIVISLLALSLNATGLEMATKQPVNLNKELSVMGWANLITGFLGGVVGYHMLSISVLNHKISLGRRASSFIAVMVLLTTLILGAGFLSFIPKMLMGGLLVYLGLSFILDWVYTAFFKLSKAEYGLVLLILCAVIFIGFLEGIFIGVIAAFILFAINYNRAQRKIQFQNTKIVKTLELVSSSTSKPERLTVNLQGYLFFGTASTLLESAQQTILTANKANELQELTLNFHHVIGIDTTAAECLLKLSKYAETKGLTVHLTDLTEELEFPLRRVGLVKPLALSSPRKRILPRALYATQQS